MEIRVVVRASLAPQDVEVWASQVPTPFPQDVVVQVFQGYLAFYFLLLRIHSIFIYEQKYIQINVSHRG